MAVKWGFDARKACLAGYLHDAAKGNPFKEFEKKNDYENYQKLMGINLSSEDKEVPQIWHAIAASILAIEKFNITDEEILSAIISHPTGDINLSNTAKILIIADYIEPYRKFDGVEKYRKSAYEDFYKTFKNILADKLDHVIKKNKTIHQKSVRANKFYL